MAVATIVDEQIGSVSITKTITIETKEVPVVYEVEYKSSTYFIDVLVTFRELTSNNRRVLHLLKIENNEIVTGGDRGQPIDFMVYETILFGLVVRFPSLSEEEISEIAEKLKNGLIKRLTHFNIEVNKNLE